METVLRVEHLIKHFPIKRKASVHAVNDVTLSVARGETLGVVGESGSGKTTVGRCIVNLIQPTSGKIFLGKEEISSLSEKDVKALRSKVQIVFQEPYESLNPRKKVRQTLEDPLVNQGVQKSERRKRVSDMLEMINLTGAYADKYPIQLTQGEQQRISVARAIMTNPDIVVLDEPTSLLDIRYRSEIISLLRTLQRNLGMAYIFITHDLVAVSQISHRIAVMYLGRIIEQGPTQTVLKTPRHPYTKALLDSVLFPDPDRQQQAVTLKGEVPSPINLPDDRCNLAPRCPLAEDSCYQTLPPFKEVNENHQVACLNETG